MSEELLEQIKEQGDLVRKLKAAKEPADKVSWMAHQANNKKNLILMGIIWGNQAQTQKKAIVNSWNFS